METYQEIATMSTEPAAYRARRRRRQAETRQHWFVYAWCDCHNTNWDGSCSPEISEEVDQNKPPDSGTKNDNDTMCICISDGNVAHYMCYGADQWYTDICHTCYTFGTCDTPTHNGKQIAIEAGKYNGPLYCHCANATNMCLWDKGQTVVETWNEKPTAVPPSPDEVRAMKREKFGFDVGYFFN